MNRFLLLTVFLLGACAGLQKGFAQALPTATAPGAYISVGATYSLFQSDYGQRVLGGTQASYDHPSNSKIVFACLLPGSLAFCFLAFRIRRRQTISGLLLLAGLFVITFGLSGCGSIQNSGTPPGTYNFLVTATGQTGVSQFVNMTMTITK